MLSTHSTSSRATALAALAAIGLLASCDRWKSNSNVSGAPESASPAVLGDLVWCDLDCNGTREPGEPGLPQVTVRVLDSDGNVRGEDTTDAEGIYRIEAALMGGRYRVVVDQSTVPNGLTPPPPVVGGNAEIAIDVPPRAGGDFVRTDLDFGFCPIPDAGVIGDFVWHDLNCDGIQDAGEPGLDGIDVVLMDDQGVEIARTTTGPNGLGLGGHYEFTGLTLDVTYLVAVDLATLPPGFEATPCEQGGDPLVDSNCSPASILLVHSDLTIDFGFCSAGGAAGEIGDFVWLDVDGDGIQDPEELDDGIDGVTVRLRDSGGQIIRTTTTATLARAGTYRFTGLAAGAYTVEIDETTLPPGFEPSPCLVGNDPEIDNNCSPAQVVLPSNTTIDRSIDFGYRSTAIASIGDFVWNDLDCDGIQDPGEPGLPGIRVLLRDDLGAQIREDTTDSAGHYEFLSLPAGTYTVEVDTASLPNLFVESPCEVGNDPTIDSNCAPATVTLAAAQHDDTIDFGFFSLVDGAIGDRVWDDLNCNGLQDPGEPGIEYVRVRLKDDTGQVIAQQNTDSNGHYTFSGLDEGSYVVEVDPTTLPSGYVAAACQVGNDPTIDNNCSPAPVTLTTHVPTDDTIDFGYHHPPCASIGDFVWFDDDCDGIQDPNEDGIAGIVVILKDASGTVIATETTDNDGFYTFWDLCTGTYTVEYDPASVPSNLSPTLTHVGNDPGKDSNASPATVVLATNTATDYTIDFGFLFH